MKLGEVGEAGMEGAKSIFSRLKEEVKGKLVVLFGNPMTGKTTLAMRLAREFSNCIIFKVDKNYDVKDFGIDGVVHEIYTPKQLLYKIDELKDVPEDTLIVVDSITSLDSYFIPSDPTKVDPRMDNLRARFCDSVLQRLQRFKFKGAVIVIAHEKLADFKTGEVLPRMNRVALRHADMLIHLTTENGKRKIRRIAVRKAVREPEFDFE